METEALHIINPEQVAAAVREAIPRLACELPADMCAGLAGVLAAEEHPRGRAVLEQLAENERVAREDHVPICQDTGTVWVCLEAGPDVLVPGNVFEGVDQAVAGAYTEARLRKSVVRDALLDRTNTGDNTPAFTEVRLVGTPGARLHVMLKGGGSDNASRVVMLVPGAGRAGIVDEVVRCVREKGANACPPLVVGVGIGATFDKVAGLAKCALMRPVGEPAANEQVAAFEAELLRAVNATGIGPGGLGGTQAALAVHVATAPCHIAALPLAINMGCSAMRRTTVPLLRASEASDMGTPSPRHVPSTLPRAFTPVSGASEALADLEGFEPPDLLVEANSAQGRGGGGGAEAAQLLSAAPADPPRPAEEGGVR